MPQVKLSELWTGDEFTSNVNVRLRVGYGSSGFCDKPGQVEVYTNIEYLPEDTEVTVTEELFKEIKERERARANSNS